MAVCSDYSPVGRKSREVDSGAAVEAEDGVGGRPRRTRGLHPVADMSTLKQFFFMISHFLLNLLMYDEKIYVNAFQRFLLKFKFFIVIISTFLSKKCNSVIRSYDLEETDKTIIYICVYLRNISTRNLQWMMLFKNVLFNAVVLECLMKYLCLNLLKYEVCAFFRHRALWYASYFILESLDIHSPFK